MLIFIELPIYIFYENTLLRSVDWMVNLYTFKVIFPLSGNSVRLTFETLTFAHECFTIIIINERYKDMKVTQFCW